jgi:hypothetical protein
MILTSFLEELYGNLQSAVDPQILNDYQVKVAMIVQGAV